MDVDPSRLLQVLEQFRQTLASFVRHGSEHPALMYRAIEQLREQIERRREQLQEDRRQTIDALHECESEVITDDEGEVHLPDCSYFHERIREIEQDLARLARLPHQLDRVAEAFGDAGHRFQAVIDRTGPAAVTWIGDRLEAIRAFERVNSADLPDSVSVSIPAPAFVNLIQTISTFNQDGKHGAAYAKARQTFLRGLVEDSNQPSYVRGWVKQELNRLNQIARARRLGEPPPGGNRYQLRGVPGLDVGHAIPGWDHPINFRLELASMNRARPGTAKRLGLDHKYR